MIRSQKKKDTVIRLLEKKVKEMAEKNNCHDPGSNRGPLELQSTALPAELLRL